MRGGGFEGDAFGSPLKPDACLFIVCKGLKPGHKVVAGVVADVVVPENCL